MPEHGFLEVLVLVDGQPLTEYPAPQDEQATDGEIVRYVQATVGKRFTVSIRWKAGFPLQGHENLHCRLEFDGTRRKKLLRCANLLQARGVLVHEQEQTFEWKRAKNGEGEWKQVFFTFGALGFTDVANQNKALTPDKLKLLGCMKVTFSRGRMLKRATPWMNDGSLDPAVEEVSENMLKGQSIKNGVKHDISERDAPPPSEHKYSYVPDTSDAANTTIFMIKYRNKEILQYLGCIPRTPSPEPDHALALERTEDMLRAEKAQKRQMNLEILRLRQQLEQAQRPVAQTADEGGIVAGQRRPRDDGDDELQVLAPPPMRAPVLVELDDD